jgi:hypothetical protein
MDDFKIPHAENVFVDRSDTPRDFLFVVTNLPEHSSAGTEADARHDMMKAIAAEVAARQLQGYKIRWLLSADV